MKKDNIKRIVKRFVNKFQYHIYSKILLDEATKERGAQFQVNNNAQKIFYTNIWSHTNTGSCV